MKRKRTELRYAGLNANTLRAYRRALDSFTRRTGVEKICFTRPRLLDRAVGEFMEEAYQEGEPISYSGHLLSALKRFYPQLRYKLPVSTQLYKNWSKTYKPQRATPASWELVEAMVALALAQGHGPMALLLAVGFDCMLRTSELLSLCGKHFSFRQGDQALSVVVPGSKTTAGNPQVLFISDDQLIKLARQTLPRHSGDLLWPRGSSTFRGVFDELIVGLGFPSGSYVPYALRRGGATFHWQQTLSLDSTVQRGRWACSRTARLYIDEGVPINLPNFRGHGNNPGWCATGASGARSYGYARRAEIGSFEASYPRRSGRKFFR